MIDIKVPLKIIKKYRIKLFLIFGSYADERSNKDSDLDLAYLSEELINYQEEMNLLRELIFFYQRDDIDLVNIRKATPSLKMEIANKAKLIYGTEEDLLNLQLYAVARYADTKFLRQAREEYLAERMKEL
jgi:uncharacterized protein